MSQQLATLDEVTEALKDVIDPELGINVVDLGLVYEMSVSEENIAVLSMTIWSPGSTGLRNLTASIPMK